MSCQFEGTGTVPVNRGPETRKPGRRWSLSAVAAAGLLFLVGTPPIAAQEPALIQAVTDAVRSAKPSYMKDTKSLALSYSIETFLMDESTKELRLENEYRHELLLQGERWKLTYKNANFLDEKKVSREHHLQHAFDGTVQRMLSTTKADGDSSDGFSEGHIRSEGDLHSRLNYFTFVNELGSKTLHYYLEQLPSSIKDAKYNGEAVDLHFEEPDTRQRYVVTLDPSMNYAVVKVHTFDAAGRLLARKEMVVKRYEDDVCLPEAGTIEVLDPDQGGVVKKIVLSVLENGLVIGPKQESSQWKVEFPAGTLVTDYTQGGITYVTGQIGDKLVASLLEASHRVDSEALIAKPKIAAAAPTSRSNVEAPPPEPAAAAPKAAHQAVSPPARSFWYFPVGAGLVITILLGFSQFRRKRATKRTSREADLRNLSGGERNLSACPGDQHKETE